MKISDFDHFSPPELSGSPPSCLYHTLIAHTFSLNQHDVFDALLFVIVLPLFVLIYLTLADLFNVNKTILNIRNECQRSHKTRNNIVQKYSYNILLDFLISSGVSKRAYCTNSLKPILNVK